MTRKHSRLLAMILSVVMVLSLIVIPVGAAPVDNTGAKEWSFRSGSEYMGSSNGLSLPNGDVKTDTVDILEIDATTGKWDSTRSDWAQLNAGTTVKIPVTTATGEVAKVTALFYRAGKFTVGGIANTKDENEAEVFTVAPVAGYVTIACTNSSDAYIGSIKVEVIEGSVAPVASVDQATVTTTAGATATTVNASVINGVATAWTPSSSAESVATATVTDAGVVTITPKAAGVAEITLTATVGSATPSTKVTVLVKLAETGVLAAGDYDFGNGAQRAAFYTTTGVTWGGITDIDNSHGPNYGSAGGTMTFHLATGKKANIILNTCGWGNGATATISGGGTIATETKGSTCTNNGGGDKITITGAKNNSVVTFGSKVYIESMSVALEDDDDPGSGGSQTTADTVPNGAHSFSGTASDLRDTVAGITWDPTFIADWSTHGPNTTGETDDPVYIKLNLEKKAAVKITTCTYGTSVNLKVKTGTVSGDEVPSTTWRENDDGNGLIFNLAEAPAGELTLWFIPETGGNGNVPGKLNFNQVYVHSIEVTYADDSGSGGGGGGGGGTGNEPVGNGKVDVWDFSAKALDAEKFNNHLTVDVIKGWFGNPATATTGNAMPSSNVTAGDMTYSPSGASNHRLRTDNSALPRYDDSTYTKPETTTDPYDSTTAKYGAVYSNSGSNRNVKITLANNHKADKITFMLSSNGNACTYHFTNAAGDDQVFEYKNTGLETATFYAQADGAYSLDNENDKLVVGRVYREHPTKTTVSGTVTAPAALTASYKVVFTNTESGITYEAPVGANGAYSVELDNYLAGAGYTTILSDEANGYVIEPTVNVTLAAADTAKTQDITVVAVDLVSVSGTVTVPGDLPLDNVKMEFVSTDPTTIFVPTVAFDKTAKTFSAQLQKGITYDIVFSGYPVNNYEIDGDTTITKTAADTAVAIALKAKAKQTITLTGTVPADETATPDLSAAKLYFANVDEPEYEYEFTGTGAISLRAGTYKVVVTNVPGLRQKLTANLKVEDAAVTTTVPFEVPTSWDFNGGAYFEGHTVFHAEGSSPVTKDGLVVTGKLACTGRTQHAQFNAGSVVKVPGAAVGAAAGDSVKIIVNAYDATTTGSTTKYVTVGGTTITTGQANVSTTCTVGDDGYVEVKSAGTGNTYLTYLAIEPVVQVKTALTVGPDKDFATIGAALAAVRAMDRANNERVTITVDPGNYEEMIVVDVPNVTLRNANFAAAKLELKNKGVDIGENEVRLTFYYGADYNYASQGSDFLPNDELLAVNKANGTFTTENKSGTNTYYNSPLVIKADGFIGEGIIFENSYNQYISRKAAEDLIFPKTGAAEGSVARKDMQYGDTTVQDRKYVHWAGALGMPDSAGKVVFDKCAFISRQDTIYGGKAVKAAFYNCDLYGGVDYICGGMAAVFAKCNLIANTSDASNDVTYHTAGQQDAGARGYLMWNCTVKSITPGVNSASTKRSQSCYFGRPWSEANSECVFYNTIVEATDPAWEASAKTSSLIRPDGWATWSGTPDKGRSDRYYEYGTMEWYTGVDNTEARVSWAKTPTVHTDGEIPTLDLGTANADKGLNYTNWLGDWNPLADKDMTPVTHTPVDREDEPDTPDTPDEPDEPATLAQQLADAIQAAETEAGNVIVSTDGSDVLTSNKWVSQTDMTTFTNAIQAAKDANVDGADDEALAAAIAALDSASKAFAEAQKDGTKRRPSSGGSAVTTQPTTSTVTNPDGSVTTTKTDKNGTVTATTVAPDGSKTEKKTTKDGDVTVVVEDAEGETLAEVEVPAAIPGGKVKFKDVPDEHWAAKSIDNMAGLGMVKGVTEDTYDMYSDINRGSIATMFFRLANGPEGKTNTFADVADGSWYADAVGWASAAGVVTGYSETAFGPEDSITRQQMAVMITRFAKLLGLDTSASASALNTFSDGAATDDWARSGMAWCVEKGILKGKGGDILDPTANVSRAEAAVMFDRMVALIK